MIKQGDIYWATFRAPDKRRPVVVLTRNSAIRHLSSITVAPITTTIRHIGSRVLLTLEDGLPEVCEVNLDAIQTIPQEKIERYITRLSDKRMVEICGAIAYALGFDDYLLTETE